MQQNENVTATASDRVSDYTEPIVPMSEIFTKMLLASMKKHSKRDMSQPNFRGDGYDDVRLAAAQTKRDRRAQRNLSRHS